MNRDTLLRYTPRPSLAEREEKVERQVLYRNLKEIEKSSVILAGSARDRGLKREG